MKLSQIKEPEQRRHFLEEKLHISLATIARALPCDEKQIHCENLIGATIFPLGVAGPVVIKKGSLSQESFIPLATTEGALVASVQRGCKALSESGGVIVYAEKKGATRGPVFLISSVGEGKRVEAWMKKEKKRLDQLAKKTSSHISLLHIDTKVVGTYLFVRFYFDTRDAMGMNMVTIATQQLVNCIEQEMSIRCLSIAGNYDVDKKPAWLNSISERGIVVRAEAVLPRQVIQDVLKTRAQAIFDVWLGKCMIGSAVSGSMGFNAHYANIVAAFFAATGQDLAHVGEGSLGTTVVQIRSHESLYISVYLPSLMIGLVGGGTKMQIKKDAIAITKAHNSIELAEILGATVLAGELSLLASLSEGTLAKAHAALGR